MGVRTDLEASRELEPQRIGARFIRIAIKLTCSRPGKANAPCELHFISASVSAITPGASARTATTAEMSAAKPVIVMEEMNFTNASRLAHSASSFRRSEFVFAFALTHLGDLRDGTSPTPTAPADTDR